MSQILMTLGRSIVKILISVFAGTGIGLVVFGTMVRDIPDIWLRPGPPPGFFVAVGAGMLTAGLMMMALFFLPKIGKTTSPEEVKRAATADWSA